MAVKLRLRRLGRKQRPIFALVAADARSPRDGRFIEDLGRYEPVKEPAEVALKEDRILYWLQQGAQPSHTVRNLLSDQGLMLQLHLLRKGKPADEIEQALAAFREHRAGQDTAAKTTAADRRREALEAERKTAEAERKRLEEERKEREAELARQRAEAEAKARQEAEAARQEKEAAARAEIAAAAEAEAAEAGAETVAVSADEVPASAPAAAADQPVVEEVEAEGGEATVAEVTEASDAAMRAEASAPEAAGTTETTEAAAEAEETEPEADEEKSA